MGGPIRSLDNQLHPVLLSLVEIVFGREFRLDGW
jgi:hypothetical protein